MDGKIVTVVGATGALGLEIAKALLAKGAQVRALVRATSDRTALSAAGVTDFVVADLLDPGTLQKALSSEPRAVAVVASAAGYTAHTKGDTAKVDTEGYHNLIDACKNAGLGRFVLISILECDKATTVPHFYNKFVAESYLQKRKQTYLALRAGAFLDQSKDLVAAGLKNGVYPEFVPGATLGMIYTPDLAKYAAQAALELPDTAMNQSVDVGWNVPATGTVLAAAFAKVLGKPVVSKPAFSPVMMALMPLLAAFNPALKDTLAMVQWIKKGDYVSKNTQKQKDLFGELPTVDDVAARYCSNNSMATTV
ncbi:MAG: NAD(P)H-binding protein [Spirochaetales bacterium]